MPFSLFKSVEIMHGVLLMSRVKFLSRNSQLVNIQNITIMQNSNYQLGDLQVHMLEI